MDVRSGSLADIQAVAAKRPLSARKPTLSTIYCNIVSRSAAMSTSSKTHWRYSSAQAACSAGGHSSALPPPTDIGANKIDVR